MKDNTFESESVHFSLCCRWVFFHWETIKIFVEQDPENLTASPYSSMLVSDTSLWEEKHNGGFLLSVLFFLSFFEYMLPFTSQPLWPWETKKLNLVETDSCPIIICVVSIWPGHQPCCWRKGWGGCYHKSCEQIGALIDRESCSQFVYYSFHNFRIQILCQRWKMN